MRSKKRKRNERGNRDRKSKPRRTKSRKNSKGSNKLIGKEKRKRKIRGKGLR